MNNKLVELLLTLQLISVCIGVDPCVDYVPIDMADGLRSSDFNSSQSLGLICDKFLDPAPWYRFEHDAGNRLIERPVEPSYCGTQAPIWMNGSHPTDRSEKTASVCATFTSENICGWSGTVRIRLCNESGSEYFVYLLAVPDGCALAYCVDAASHKECIPPEVWFEDEFRCGVSGTPNSTVPLTELVTILTTSATITSTSTEHQSSTPTLRPSIEPNSTVPLTEVTTLITSATITSSSTENQSLSPTLTPSIEPNSTVPQTEVTTLTTTTTITSTSTEHQSLSPTLTPSIEPNSTVPLTEVTTLPTSATSTLTENQSLSSTLSSSTEPNSTVPLTEVTTLTTLTTSATRTSTEHQSISPTLSSSTEPNSTVPLTEVTTLTTSATITSPSTEHQSLSPSLRPSTEPASSGWSTWGPWSVCSKPCDYGYQSRRRTCGQLPCEGPANDEQLCNEYNCKKLPDEKTRGIALVFQSPETQEEDTMLTFVLNQPEIHDILRKNINDICSQNVSLCCGWQYNGISPLDQEFVQPSDIYPAQGSLEPKSENTVYSQVIAIVNEDIDREICKGHSQRIHAKEVESSQNFLSFDVMLMASEISADNISQETGLIVVEYIDPATMTEDDDEEDEVSCPYLTCVLPIVICITVVVTAAVIGGFCFAKRKLKSKTEPEAPSPEPPQYEDVLSTDLRVNIKELPYIIGLSLPTDVSHNDYNTHVDQGSLDFQKIYLDVLSKKL